jgi:hypothetical protein
MFRKQALAVLLIAIFASTLYFIVLAQEPDGEITATYTLPDTPVEDLHNAVLPGSIANDRNILLGGIGSDLWRNPSDPADEFWMITDRGPNSEVKVDGEDRRAFPIPEFTPLILRVKLEGASINILQTIPIVNSDGQPVTGLSNLAERDEVPFDYTASEELAVNQDGIDPEGMVRASNGDFWLVEEYAPSLLHINAEGEVVKRYVPEGLSYPAANYEVVDNLPAVLSARRGNRGFEGLALSPDETTLYAVIQSPLENPTRKVSNNSRNTRIIVFDIDTESVVGEYVYRFQEYTEFEAAELNDMKISGLIATSPTTLLVLERTDDVAKIYEADLSNATNIYGTRWDDLATDPSLEATGDLGDEDITPADKALVIDISLLDDIPDKIEGIALLDNETLVIANDNDFDMGEFDEEGNNQGEGLRNHILVIKLDQPIQ